MDDEELNMWRWVTVEFLRKLCRLDEVSEDDILHMVGIINTNGVSQGPMRGHGLYPTFSYISHRLGSSFSSIRSPQPLLYNLHLTYFSCSGNTRLKLILLLSGVNRIQ